MEDAVTNSLKMERKENRLFIYLMSLMWQCTQLMELSSQGMNRWALGDTQGDKETFQKNSMTAFDTISTSMNRALTKHLISLSMDITAMSAESYLTKEPSQGCHSTWQNPGCVMKMMYSCGDSGHVNFQRAWFPLWILTTRVEYKSDSKTVRQWNI